MKPVITTDLDGVQCQFNPAFHAWVNTRTGRNLNYAGQKSFHYEECWGETKEYWDSLMKEFCGEGHLANLPVIREAANAVKKLSKKYQIFAVTFRHPKTYGTTLEYVRREIPEISNIFFRSDKAKFCHEVKAIAHIEDNLDCVKSFTNGTTAYLMDRPWNRSEPYAKRVTSWEPILKEL